MNSGARVPSGTQDAREQQQRRTVTPPQSALSTTAIRTSPESKDKAPPVTLQELNLLQQQVRANPNDHATALKLAKKLVEAVSVLANEGGKADAKTTAKNREKYSFDAHKLLKKLVSAGYPEAMFYLADCHGSGRLGLEVDPKEAFTLYQSAAKLNHPQSAYRVAVCCEMGAEEGGGTRRDPLKAIQWYKRAATLGDTPAMYKMGMILLKGLLSQPKNPREALSWLKRAAERADAENPHALHELGLLYESAAPNDAIIRDENYSRELFTQAAELGYKYSQFRLGSAYEYGMLGCPIDARQSIAWYSRAAAQGEHQSELALSGWYLTGSEGLIQQSDTEAYLWARKSANSGLAKAEYAMGYFTEVGIGAPANMEDAKRWYWRAACELRENAPIFNEFDC
jgi:TPR repeat protein